MSEAPLRQFVAVPAAVREPATASHRPDGMLRARGRQATALALAGGTLLAWSLVVITLHPGAIGDEKSHYPVAAALAQGQAADRSALPMPPTFHWLAAGWMRLAGTSLNSVRVLNTLILLAAVGLYAGAARARHGAEAGPQILLLAWNPLLLPYAVLVYTEPLSVMLLVLALWMHASRRTGWAAAVLLAACAVRQSNVLWLLLFAVWSVADRLDTARNWRAALVALRSGGRDLVRETRPYGLALAAVLGAFAAWPTWLLQPSDMNRPGVNPALLVSFGLVVAVVWAPLWFEQARKWWPTHIRPHLYRALPVVLVLAAVAALAGLYDNPHCWNDRTGFLHDRFAHALSASAAARLGVAALIVLVLPLLTLHLGHTRQRWACMAAWASGLLFLAPHSLVDPRYFIHPLILIHFFTRYEAASARRLCAWSLVLALATCGYTLIFGGPASGL